MNGICTQTRSLHIASCMIIHTLGPPVTLWDHQSYVRSWLGRYVTAWDGKIGQSTFSRNYVFCLQSSGLRGGEGEGIGKGMRGERREGRGGKVQFPHLFNPTF